MPKNLEWLCSEDNSLEDFLGRIFWDCGFVPPVQMFPENTFLEHSVVRIQSHHASSDNAQFFHCPLLFVTYVGKWAWAKNL